MVTSRRISTSALQVTAIDARVLEPQPSATTWSRLEPLPTSDDVADSLRARIADPLWMLLRQWQFNELAGEDAGSPVEADYQVDGIPLRTLGSADGNAALQPLPDGAAPVEMLVEREPVLAVHPKLNAQAGQHLMRMLRAQGLAAALPRLLDSHAAQLAPPDDAVADTAGFVWNTLLHRRAVDARRLAADLRPLDAAGRAAFGAALGLGAAEADVFSAVATGWLGWLDQFVCEPGQPGPTSPYWNPQRLEYSFALQANVADPPVRLVAQEYTDGRLDWHSYDVAAGGAAPPEPEALLSIRPDPQRHKPLPTLARYPGMPADRYWEFEDGRVSFGTMGAAKSDLARLALIEYALVFGNDWFVLPLKLPANTLFRVRRLAVKDNFGIASTIPAATNPDGSDWTMFELSLADAGVPRERLADTLYLCPKLDTLEGPPLEQVRLMRDEMANLVWGIETRVMGSSGEPLDRRYEAHRLSMQQALRPPPGVVVPPPGEALRYRLQTPVAPHWIPFLPVRKQGATPGQWAIQLQRAVVTQFYEIDPLWLAAPRNAAYRAFIRRLDSAGFVEAKFPAAPDRMLQGYMFHPRGTLLRLTPEVAESLFTKDFLRLEEEEVPREGIELRRAFNYARDAQGRALLWIGRSKSTGRGEGASGLRYDVVGPREGAG